MTHKSRYIAARTRIENVAAHVSLSSQNARASLSSAASEIRAVLDEFPVLRRHVTDALCSALTAASARPNFEFPVFALLVNSILSGEAVSNTELDVCAGKLAGCARDLLGSRWPSLILHFAVHCPSLDGCGFFFLCALKDLVERKQQCTFADNNIDNLMCRCNVALEKMDSAALSLRWHESRELLRIFQNEKAHRDRVLKGFKTAAKELANSKVALVKQFPLLFLHLRSCESGSEVLEIPSYTTYLPWNSRIRIPLDFIMAMYAARPNVVLKCLQKMNGIQTLACAIISEFSASNESEESLIPSNSYVVRFPFLKCLFLSSIDGEWTGSIICNPLPEVLMPVSIAENGPYRCSPKLTVIHCRTVVNIYLKRLVRRRSPTSAFVADLIQLVKLLFAAAVHHDIALVDVLSEYISPIPARCVQQWINGILVDPFSTDITLLNMCKVVHQLAKDSPCVREGFLRSLACSNLDFLCFYKAVSHAFHLADCEKPSVEDVSSTFRVGVFLTVLIEVCNTATFVAERSFGKQMWYIKLNALKHLEQHFTWLLLKLSHSALMSVLVKAWEKLHSCICLVYSEKPSNDTQLSRRSNVVACRCGAVRIADFLSGRRPPSFVGECNCKSPNWFFPTLPNISEWVFWEMYWASCILLHRERFEGPNEIDSKYEKEESIAEENRLWNRWAFGLHVNARGSVDHMHNEVIKYIFHGFLQSRRPCLTSFETLPAKMRSYIPCHMRGLIRMVTATSSFSSVPWFYGSMKSTLDSEIQILNDQCPNRNAKPIKGMLAVFKHCMETFLAGLPKRHLFPFCSDRDALLFETQSAEQALRLLLSGKHELENCVTDFPLISCYTAHLGNMTKALCLNSGTFSRVETLCTYVNSSQNIPSPPSNIGRLPPTKDRIIGTFFI